MPLYEYKCGTCGAVKTEMRAVDERNEPLRADCAAPPFDVDLVCAPKCDYRRILSPTRTTFVFADTGRKKRA